MAKRELEFFDPKVNGTWRRPEGYPEGITELIITECPETKVNRPIPFHMIAGKKYTLSMVICLPMDIPIQKA